MGFLREIALFAAVILALYLPWTILVHAALRISGQPVNIWPGKGNGSANDSVLRKLGKQKFVVIEGVLLWGWPVFAASSIFDYLSYKYLGGHDRLSPVHLIGGLLIWSAVGYAFGLRTWNKSSGWDFELDS